MRFLRFLFSGTLLALIGIFFVSLVAYAALTWSETQPGGNMDLSWTPSAMSSDGQKMIVGVQNDGIYISSNGGDTWTEIFPTGVDDGPDWYTANMSSDGQKIVAGVFTGRLYRSIDGGENWAEMQPAGDIDHSWYTTSMSSDGLVLLAGIRNGRLYKSVDGGNFWSETQPAGNNNEEWSTSAMSSDGQKMIAGYLGRIYQSTDKGDTWSEIQPAGDQDQTWQVAAMSPNGEVIIVGTSDQLFLSKNGSDTWAEVQPAGDTYKIWRLASVSSDGNTLFVGNSERLYLSSDTGDTWSETQPAGDVNKDWTLGSMSSDSHTLLAGVYGGRLYIGANPSPTPTPNSGGGGGSSSGSPNNSNTTPTCSTTPNGAPNLFQINTTKDSANLFFSPVANAQNYLISYGFDSNANQFNVFTNQGDSTGVLSYTVNSLPSGSNIYYKVFAQNNCGQGNWSNTMKVTTNGRIYYKDIISQITSIFPKQTTVLGAKTNKVLGVTADCETYTVKSGDSLWSIASEKLGSGSSYSSIMKSNSLNSSVVNPGKKLKVGC